MRGTRMRTRVAGVLMGGLMLAGLQSPVAAASLQIAPVSVQVPAPGASASLALRNLGNQLLNAQIRVFRWVQKGGKDKLVATRDVVASPPFARLAPNGIYTLRIIRVSKAPIKGEEAYRLLIDELPTKENTSGSSVRLVVRYSVPVFFGANRASPPRLAWRVSRSSRKTVVSVTNHGGRHVRISKLSLIGKGGRAFVFSPGLVGYVLGNSNASWSKPRSLRGLKPGSEVIIKAQGDNGPIQAKTRVENAN